MNWKRILIISLLVNLILLAAIWYKYSMTNHPSTEKIDALIQTSLAMNSRAIDGSVEYMEPTLRKRPKLRETIADGISKMRESNSETIGKINELVMKIETIENDTGGIDLERRVLPYQLLTADGGLDSMELFIARHLVFMDKTFEETILNSKKELKKLLPDNYVENIRSSVPKLDIEAKVKSLKNVSLLESRLVLHSIQLDMSNVESVYINAIADLIPSHHKTRFEKLKVVIHPKTSRVILGEKYEAELAVVGYFPSFAKNSTIKINGKEYPFSEDGLVHYKVKPNRVGKHTLKLEAQVLNELSGERMSSSSTYEYNVLP
jgi:hypothetical protein